MVASIRLATIGDIAVDIRAAAGEALTRGADARGAIRFLPGGSAANVAVWAARLGARATCVGAVGADPWGAWLADDLRREGVAMIGPHRGRTATILTFLHADGERTFVTDRAAALSLQPRDLPDTLWDGLDMLHIPAYSLFEGALAETATWAAHRARERGVALSIDLSSASLLRAYGPARFAALLARPPARMSSSPIWRKRSPSSPSRRPTPQWRRCGRGAHRCRQVRGARYPCRVRRRAIRGFGADTRGRFNGRRRRARRRLSRPPCARTATWSAQPGRASGSRRRSCRAKGARPPVRLR